MLHTTALLPVLQAHLQWHPSRLRFLILFLTALLKVTTVNLAKVANAFSAQAQVSSHYRRIQRFLALFQIDYSSYARLLLALIPAPPNHLGQLPCFIVSIDRTNWKFGKSDINILMAAIVHQGTAFPLVWRLIPTAGSSNVEERTDLIDALLEVLPAWRIKVLVADREFIGALWFQRLCERRIAFSIRLRGNTVVEHTTASRCKRQTVHRQFAHLQRGEQSSLRKPRRLLCHRLYLSAVRTEKSLIIVASNRPGIQALNAYRQRWGIEVLFGVLKRRGFDFECTHLQARQRIEKLVALLALAYVWAYRIGQWQARRRAIPIKKHGRKARSLFRTGLDYLQHVLLHPVAKRSQWETCLWLLIDPLVMTLLDLGENTPKSLNF